MFSPLLVISIHEVFADLDTGTTGIWRSNTNFNPRGLRRPRLICRRLPQFPGFISIHEVFADLDEHALYHSIRYNQFQSTRSSQTSTRMPVQDICPVNYFNPRGLRRPRLSVSAPGHAGNCNFNPRGLCRPRPIARSLIR